MSDDPREDVDPGEAIEDVRNDPVPTDEDDPSVDHIETTEE